MNPAASSGPSIMGIDLVTVATLLSAVAAFSVMLAIYAATTVRDPMAKRVKALNERREQLKAGIVASTSKRRKSITQQNEVADKVRGILSSLKVLQDEQVIKAQKRLLQAGVRSKEYAFVVIFARLVMPIVVGIIMLVGVYGLGWLGTWSSTGRYGVVAVSVLLAYKSPDIGQSVSGAGGRIRPHLDRARLPHGPAPGVREFRQPHRPGGRARRGHDHDPDGEIRHTARLGFARAVGRIPQRADDACGGEGRAAAGHHDGAADPVHPADPVHRDPGSSGLRHRRRLLEIDRLRNKPPRLPLSG
jgi:hypothetical protein